MAGSYDNWKMRSDLDDWAAQNHDPPREQTNVGGSVITILAVRDEDKEKAVLAIEALIMRTARNSAGGWACMPYEDIAPLARKIVRLIGEMTIGCTIAVVE